MTDPTPQMSAFRRFLLPVLAIVVSSVVGLVLMEIMLRVVDYSRPPFWQYDAEFGAAHRPNTTGWYVKENMVKIDINSQGLRGPETTIEKPKGVFRVAILGDSFAEGFTVNFDELFSTIMEQRLNAERCRGHSIRVEILNFGVSGFGQAREILMFRHRVRRYDPDLVLVLFHGGNDFRDNTKRKGALLPYFVFKGDELVLDRSALDTPAFARKLRWSVPRNDVVANVRVLQVLYDFYERVILTSNAAAVEDDAPAKRDRSPHHPRTIVTAPPETDADRQAWRLTEAHFHLLAGEVRAATRRRLWVANVPPGLAVLPNVQERAQILAAMDLENADYVEQRLASVFKEADIGFMPLTAPLRQASERTGVNMHYHAYSGNSGGHWNALAHRVTGEAIAETLCSVTSSAM